jgi:polyhydroxyalkanoate synthesis regulator protein
LVGFSPFSQFGEMSKQNLTMFQEAMAMLSPFKGGVGNQGGGASASGGTARDATGNIGNIGNIGNAAAAAGDDVEKVQGLESRLSEIQKRLDELTSK